MKKTKFLALLPLLVLAMAAVGYGSMRSSHAQMSNSGAVTRSEQAALAEPKDDDGADGETADDNERFDQPDREDNEQETAGNDEKDADDGDEHESGWFGWKK